MGERKYHVLPIEKGIYGEASKINEELMEIEDAKKQETLVMELVELSDLYGAIVGFLEEKETIIYLEKSYEKAVSDWRLSNTHENALALKHSIKYRVEEIKNKLTFDDIVKFSVITKRAMGYEV